MHCANVVLLLWEVILTAASILPAGVYTLATIAVVTGIVPPKLRGQGHKREEWIRAREEELLKVPYFHVVFTLPSELNRLCLYEPKLVYALLFKIAWQVIKGFSSNPKFLGANPGMIAILHTWGQNLSLHPHLHCIVPGGGITQSGTWKPARNKGKYLFPVKANTCSR
jgi:hypothetical protein